MYVSCVYAAAGAVAHQRHPHVCVHTTIHEPGRESVAQIMEPHMSQASAPQGCLPSGLDAFHSLPLIRKNEAVAVFIAAKCLYESGR